MFAKSDWRSKLALGVPRGVRNGSADIVSTEDWATGSSCVVQEPDLLLVVVFEVVEDFDEFDPLNGLDPNRMAIPI